MVSKTLTAITIMGCLFVKGKVKRALIVAPASVCSVWPRELESFAGFPWEAKVLLGDKSRRLSALREFERPTIIDGVKIAIINYDSVFREDLFAALMGFDPDLIIADESQRIKSHRAKQSKAMHKLGDKAKYKLILSGTPVQNNVVDLYSQYRFMDSSIFGTNFYAFRNRYCIMGGFQQHQIIDYQRMDELIRKVHSAAYRVTKAEALDLPEKTFENRYVTLTAKERKVYDQLRRDGFTALLNEETITATTVLTKLLRLQQFTGGFLPVDSGWSQVVNTAKLDALEDILQDYVIDGDRKMVIFARFKPEIKAIASLLEHLKIRYAAIDGEVPIPARSGIVEDFQTNPHTLVFLAQLQCAGLGITLTAASVAVYYSINFNYADYTQSLSRIHRIGQKNNCHYIHLLVENSIDEKTLETLAEKDGIAKKLVDNWRSYFE